ncbi:UNVERIFIED_CONTAM: hypothetical protein Sangu_0696200 [Sesamum angustifolium]|uniref:Endonuclease/exonuclease/phosphatase domain-containing protein n=1 Tax=Sesamum angustifolium TaxID=2727405 RepID=A0AAW2PR99_9LAMI
METKCRSFGIERVKKFLNMHGLAVDSIGKGGGLALLWDKEVFVDLVSFSRYHMDARVQLREGEDYWRFTGFYGEPDSSKRAVSWDLLKCLSRLSNLPWICVGDYNAILSDIEKEGSVPTPQWQLRSFREALSNSGLHDVNFLGSPFTWQILPCVRKRLDRACVNLSWTTKWPATVTQHLDRIYSDHAPIITVREKQCEKWAEVGVVLKDLKHFGSSPKIVRQSSQTCGITHQGILISLMILLLDLRIVN